MPKYSLSEHERKAQELVISGETPKTSEQVSRELRGLTGVREKREEEIRRFASRIIWWAFIVVFILLWVWEIVMFSSWWGWLGTFVGFVLGPFLLPFFPFLSLFEQQPGVAASATILLVIAGTCLVYAWPEALRVIRALRR